MMGITALKGGLTVQYLLPCTGGYLMVEAGDHREFPRFLSKLKKAGVDPREIRYLFLTHHHGDHAGFTASLREISDCRIIAHREAAPFMREGSISLAPGGGATTRLVKFIFSLGLRLNRAVKTGEGNILVEGGFPPVEPQEGDILVQGDDNEILRSLGVPGKIMHTPGHTPDSITLLLDDGSCFCGDAATSFALWLGTRYCCFYITDMAANYQTWRKMLDAGARTIYPAHGKPFPAEKLQSNLDHYSQEDLQPISI